MERHKIHVPNQKPYFFNDSRKQGILRAYMVVGDATFL
jgi:hypothetical protein